MAGALSRFSACATYEKGGRSLFKEPATHRSATAYSDLAKGFCPFGVFLTYKSTQASAANILYPEDPVCGDSQASSEKTEEVHHAKRKESKSCFYPFRVPDSTHLSMEHTAAGFIRHGGREQHALSYHQLCLALLPGHDPVRSVLPVDRVVLQIQKHTAGAGRSQAGIQQKRLVLHALLRRYGRRSGLLGSGTGEAMRFAFARSFLHWGIHPWVNYSVLALALAYMQFRKGQPGLISSVFLPLIGEKEPEAGWEKRWMCSPSLLRPQG